MKKGFGVLSWLIALSLLLCACAPALPQEPEAPSSSESLPPPVSSEDTPASSEDPGPQPERFTLSFAGDCTLGDNYDKTNRYNTFCQVVGDDYDYPLANVRDIFQHDDLTLVNLECALTEAEPTEEEMEELKDHLFRFRGPKAYAKILSGSGVEFASCANNHSRDYGKQGLQDTLDALTAENVHSASAWKNCLITTPGGLKVGIYCAYFVFSKNEITNQVRYLREQGAQIVIVSVHWGDEGTYRPNEKQQDLGHLAIDAGADIVYGHHSHTLQPIEWYNGGVIYYSLGNFSFGGSVNPRDKDTAILQQEILRYPDGTVTLGSLRAIPCSVSSVENRNDYRPTPYGQDQPGYQRVFEKLEGSFEGADLEVSYPTQTEKS